jgi:hypothetical protein
VQKLGLRVIADDFLDQSGYARHATERVAEILMRIATGQYQRPSVPAAR